MIKTVEIEYVGIEDIQEIIDDIYAVIKEGHYASIDIGSVGDEVYVKVLIMLNGLDIYKDYDYTFAFYMSERANDLKAEAEALKNEKQALAERQKVAENKAESLKKWLAYALQGEEFKTPKCAISFRKSEAVEVTDEGLNNLMKEHDELLTYKAPEPNTTAIKQALKDGLNVAGVQLVQNTSTIIK